MRSNRVRRFRCHGRDQHGGRCRLNLFARDIALLTRRDDLNFAVAERRTDQFDQRIFRQSAVRTDALPRAAVKETSGIRRHGKQSGVARGLLRRLRRSRATEKKTGERRSSEESESSVIHPRN